MSTASFSGVASSKPWINLASVNCVTCIANVVPGQDRRPDPNGQNSKFFPETSSPAAWLPANHRPGSNSSGSGQTRGSRWSFHTLGNTRVPFRMLYPPISQSSVAWCGTESGPGG
ncbi:hypothetical protein RHMOL_Rhmol01G0294700 [Rhododendron molle]|uniref:Uncharacterized protein n=1 Tax=Rhododendron molle TaxID=49168 RepID=A0ACC0Q6M0_RHOML|nr:hypothetical protein RHMOL_Rhmol01G0294700 [Rhododendron molle]